MDPERRSSLDRPSRTKSEQSPFRLLLCDAWKSWNKKSHTEDAAADGVRVYLFAGLDNLNVSCGRML
jgi:hypothetical protein